MKTGLKKSDICKTLVTIFALIGFAFGVYAIADTVKATGTGYFMFLNTGVFSRGIWDVICTLVITLMIICLVAIPVMLVHGSAFDMALLLLANGALTVYVRPDRMLAPFTGGVELDKYGVFIKYLDYTPVWIFSIVFLLIIAASAEDQREERTVKIYIIKSAGISALMLLLGYLINDAFELFLFAAGYTALLPILMIPGREKRRIMIIPGTVFFICMLWKLYMATALYHM